MWSWSRMSKHQCTRNKPKLLYLLSFVYVAPRQGMAVWFPTVFNIIQLKLKSSKCAGGLPELFYHYAQYLGVLSPVWLQFQKVRFQMSHTTSRTFRHFLQDWLKCCPIWSHLLKTLGLKVLEQEVEQVFWQPAAYEPGRKQSPSDRPFLKNMMYFQYYSARFIHTCSVHLGSYRNPCTNK